MYDKLVLITGGAGFIGSNLAHSLMSDGQKVRILDNLSRPGAKINLPWLQSLFPKELEFVRGDVRDFSTVQDAMRDVGTVFHYASQVAVTTSIQDPRHDFEVNALGALNVLEAARLSEKPPVVAFPSTNKVYGGMNDLEILEKETRYEFKDFPKGISEERPLDFHSPYGCSKGAADQYMIDYARVYGIPTVVFRMSCIYGTRQFGTEDQGWLAHMMISSILGKQITIFGNGKQVRDILWVGDVVRAFRMAVAKIETTAGKVYNIGGGPENSISIWAETGPIISELLGHAIPVSYGAARAGDQRVYISDTSKAKKDFDWQPLVGKRQGIEMLYEWLHKNSEALR